ncbi:MAG: O-acetyl-ADP-ribose deacetylase [Chloroflexota bacterium]
MQSDKAAKEKKYQHNQTIIALCQGNIVDQDVEVIVNAANSALSGGGGVDGAIHRAAGPELLGECRTLGTCPTGEARMTKGYHLRASYVIHAVGPVYRGQSQDAELLASAYRNSLLLASQHQLTTIAFPSISTGAYRYPLDQASLIALQTVIAYLDQQHNDIALVRFILWEQQAYRIYEQTADRILLSNQEKMASS